MWLVDTEGKETPCDAELFVATTIPVSVPDRRNVAICVSNADDFLGKGLVFHATLFGDTCRVVVQLDKGTATCTTDDDRACAVSVRQHCSTPARELLPSFPEASTEFMEQVYQPFIMKYGVFVQKMKLLSAVAPDPEDESNTDFEKNIQGLRNIVEEYAKNSPEDAEHDLAGILQDIASISENYATDVIGKHCKVCVYVQNYVIDVVCAMDCGSDEVIPLVSMVSAFISDPDPDKGLGFCLDSDWVSFCRANHIENIMKKEDTAKVKLSFMLACPVVRNSMCAVDYQGNLHAYFLLQSFVQNTIPVPRAVLRLRAKGFEPLDVQLNFHRCMRRMGFMDMDDLSQSKTTRLFYLDQEQWFTERNINCMDIVGDDWKVLGGKPAARHLQHFDFWPVHVSTMVYAKEMNAPRMDFESIQEALEDDASAVRKSHVVIGAYNSFHVHLKLSPILPHIAQSAHK